jgi:hypothetical protein
MALQLGALRDALVEAGASEEKAQKAAEEMAGYDREFADVRSDLKLLKWMQGATFAGVVAIMFRLLIH